MMQTPNEPEYEAPRADELPDIVALAFEHPEAIPGIINMIDARDEFIREQNAKHKQRTYTSFCHRCDGAGGWVDTGRGWDCAFGPEPDEWRECPTCKGAGIVIRVFSTPPSNDDDFEDSDPFAE